MLLATEIPLDMPVGQYALSAIVSSFMLVFGLLLRKTFTDFSDQLKSMDGKLNAISASQAHGETRMSVLESKVDQHAEELERLRDKIHHYGNLIASLEAKMFVRGTPSGRFPAVGNDE
jgi:septal ring factor EnvC (AmiA/AmiB activator)